MLHLLGRHIPSIKQRLIFQGAEKSLRQSIIETITRSRHAADHAMALQ